MNTWILTFARPAALNRQIAAFSRWTNVKVFSNHPEIQLTKEHADFHTRGLMTILYNSLSDPEATSYCARSWNNIFLKGFKDADEMICVQDDTFINDWERFRDLIIENKEKYDFIWGPAGDQFFYIKKKVLKKVGFFDERYGFCYCGDADFLKRVWHNYDRSKLSIVEKHDFGFVHNSIGLENYIPTDVGSKSIDKDYANQHWEAEKLGTQNHGILSAQRHWVEKWGHALNGVGSFTKFTLPPTFKEIQWYPWFDVKYLDDGPRKNGVYE
jgi:hypothetical protein